MTFTTMFPGEQMLADAADLIEARGWNRTADPYAVGQSGALSVRGAVEMASGGRDWQVTGSSDSMAVPPVTADDGLCALAAYVIDTVLIPTHSVMVSLCPACNQCQEHAYRPLTLIRKACPNGCELCEEHVHLSDPHGYDAPAAEDVVDAWEGFMPHQRDVISGLRAAASRPEL